MESLRRRYVILGTVLFDLFILWTVIRFVLGGWDRAVYLYSHGPLLWAGIILTLVVLTLIRSDFRTDIPMYLSAFALAYWLEWWGTTRGVWTYTGDQKPPLGEIFLWGICLLSVYHVNLVFLGKGETEKERGKGSCWTWFMVLALFVLPLIGLVLTWKFIISVNWMNYFDCHSVAAVVLASFLILKDFELGETFWVFVGGTFLGGLLETLGTASGRYAYLSGQGAPLMVGPIWGVTCVVMVKLGYRIRNGFFKAAEHLSSLRRQ